MYIFIYIPIYVCSSNSLNQGCGSESRFWNRNWQQFCFNGIEAGVGKKDYDSYSDTGRHLHLKKKTIFLIRDFIFA